MEPEPVDFTTIPEGTYRCRIAEVRPGTTRGGDERWSLLFVVTEGEHATKPAAWDSIVFSTRGRARARMVLAALGLPSTGRVTVKPEDVEGREAMVTVRNVTYGTPSGTKITRNEVPYDGVTAFVAADDPFDGVAPFVTEVARASGRAPVAAAVDAITEALEDIAEYVDTRDGSDGRPMPNAAMRAQQSLQEALAKLRPLLRP